MREREKERGKKAADIFGTARVSFRTIFEWGGKDVSQLAPYMGRDAEGATDNDNNEDVDKGQPLSVGICCFCTLFLFFFAGQYLAVFGTCPGPHRGRTGSFFLLVLGRR